MKTKATAKNLFSPITIRSHENLAQAVKRIRKLQGCSQVDLAKKTGLTQATISRVESGNKRVEIGTLVLIFSALQSDIVIVPRPKGDTSISLEGLF